jgi:asparagine synthase (glutamine-hydrolysing)
MCGIWVSAGKLSNDGRTIASNALDLVRHRGPDGVGIWASAGSPPVIIGHRRLAVIDLDTRANQPMTSHDGRYVITFNGEIFNYREVRLALENKGTVLKTASDTEVLLEALARWGLNVLEKLRGFFAFVLFDQQERRLLAARDRYGIKPLYYAVWPGLLTFASEIKQFRALPDFARRLNDEALIDYLAFGLFDHSSFTFFEGVYQIEPGQAVSVCLDTIQDLKIEMSTWVIERENVIESNPDSLRTSLTAAVSLGLTSDVPLGVALSGGIDSSAVATIAASIWPVGPKRPMAVGMFFDQPDIDESQYARAVAERANLDLVRGTITSDELEELFRATVWSFDEPIVRASMLVQMKLYRVFKERGIKVVLSGQGGDEMFCGYPFAWPSLLLDILSRVGWSSFVQTAQANSVSVRAMWTELAPVGFVEHALLHAMRKPAVFEEVLTRSFEMDVARCRVRRGRLKRSSKLESRSARFSRRLMEAGNLPMLLHYDDRAGMASSVESRPVLLDPDLVATALAIPADMKAAGGRLKGALRIAMHNELPPVVRDRKDKLGFPAPEGQWMAGAFGEFLVTRAKAGLELFSSSLAQVVDVDEIRTRLAQRYLQGTPIWFLASLGEWGIQF